MMKTEAILLTDDRKVELREIDIPEIADDEILVECEANGVCMLEVSQFTGAERFGYPFPLGHEGIGRVIQIGKNVKRVREGDTVHCNSWSRRQIIRESAVKLFETRPEDVATALVEPVSCIVSALFSYNIMPGDRVIVLGAGYMGLLNIIGLAHSPISELVVTDLRDSNLKVAQSLGATRIINGATDQGRSEIEALSRVGPLGPEGSFDLVVECAGTQETVDLATRLTRRGGRLAIFSWHHKARNVDLRAWHIGGFTVINASPQNSTDRSVNTFQRAIQLIECGMFDQSQLITHRHSYREAQEALELAAEKPDGYIKGVLLFD